MTNLLHQLICLQVSDEDGNSGAFSIAFPSISTSTFAFDINKAVPVTLQVIQQFLAKHPEEDIRIYLVDIADSDTLKIFRKHNKINDQRFIIAQADITKMYSQKYPCRFDVQ